MSEQDLQAITGLSREDAAHLLEASNGDISAAVQLHFAEVDARASTNNASNRPPAPPTPPTRQRLSRGSEGTAGGSGSVAGGGSRPRSPRAPVAQPTALASQTTRGWERFLAQIYRMLGSFTTHTVNELLSFIKGIFIPNAHVTDLSFANRLQSIIPPEHPARAIGFVEPPFGNALSRAVNEGVPLVVLGLDFRALSHASHAQRLTNLLEILQSPLVLTALQQTVVCYGHSMESSVWSSLTTRALGLQSPASLTILLPLRLSPSVAEQYRLILRGRSAPVQLRQSDNFPGLTSPETGVRWSADVQERLIEALQAAYVSVAAEPAMQAHIGIELLRGCLLSCCRLTITGQTSAEQVATVINTARRLAQPIQEKSQEIELRRQQDRELRERQQYEYEESLRADRQRAQEKADRERAEAEAARAEAEAREAEQLIARQKALEATALARRMLSAASEYPDAADSDFADISLRIAPANERVRVRVHRALSIAKLQQTLSVLDSLLQSDVSHGLVISGAVEKDLPSCVRGLGGDDQKKSYQHPLVPTDGAFQLISMGAGPLDGNNTVERSGLLPNAVLHLRPTSI